jgi:transcriptional regulator with XRE-family HTH domain
LNRELIKFPDGVKNRTEAIQHRIEHAGIIRKISHNQVRAIRVMLSGTHEDMKQIETDGKILFFLFARIQSKIYGVNILDWFGEKYQEIQRKVVFLPKNRKTLKLQVIMFNERIKQLREDLQIPQRKLAAALDIDTASYCKIEKGERRARKEYIPIIAELLQGDKEELLTLWLADKVAAVVADDRELSGKVLSIAKKNINKSNI